MLFTAWRLPRRQGAGAALFNGPYYFAEQLGFRKVIDSTFMIAAMINGDPDLEDVANTSRRCAAPSATSTCGPSSTRTTTRTSSPTASTPDGHPPLGPGERIVFEPYTKEVYEKSFEWIAERGIFPGGDMGPAATRTPIVSPHYVFRTARVSRAHDHERAGCARSGRP
jgi:hypothetical protein